MLERGVSSDRVAGITETGDDPPESRVPHTKSHRNYTFFTAVSAEKNGRNDDWMEDREARRKVLHKPVSQRNRLGKSVLRLVLFVVFLVNISLFSLATHCFQERPY